MFDTSTLIGAALREGSNPDLALTQALATGVVYMSVEKLAELSEVLERRKFDGYLGLGLRRAFVESIRESVRMIFVAESEVIAVQPPCRDGKDNKFLALALAEQADVIVASDQDLLVLHPWNGIPLVMPAQFLVWDLESGGALLR